MPLYNIDPYEPAREKHGIVFAPRSRGADGASPHGHALFLANARDGEDTQLVDTCVAAPPPEPLAAPKKVAVVITVHDAPEWVERTLTSLWAHADSPAGRALPDAGDAIFLVNDASGAETLRRLREVVEARGRARRLAVRLVNWDGGHRLDGYTRAANLGIRAALREAPYAAFCLLNSDVEVVDPRWLETLKRHAFSDPTIGVVGPLSNAASYQSVPELRVQTGKESEDWSKNELPPGPADDPWTPRGLAAARAPA